MLKYMLKDRDSVVYVLQLKIGGLKKIEQRLTHPGNFCFG